MCSFFLQPEYHKAANRGGTGWIVVLFLLEPQTAAVGIHLNAMIIANTSEPMSAAIEERHLAVIGLMNTPIGVAHQFFQKMKVVEELIAKESIYGISTANYPMMVISSLKREFVNLDDDGHNALFHLQEKP